MNKRAIQRVADAIIAIEGVYLINSNLYLRDDWSPMLATGEYIVQYKDAEPHINRPEQVPVETDSELILFDYSVGVRLLRQEDFEQVKEHSESAKKYVMAEITAIFRGYYRLRKDESYCDKDLAEFAATNVSFNIWPYWREYLQTSCMRTGLPMIPLPVKKTQAAIKFKK